MKAPATLLLLALLGYLPASAQTTPQAVTSFVLVNADTDLDIMPLVSGDSINLVQMPTRNLNIRATTTPAAVGSVEFSLTGADTRDQTESLAPYALFSDAGGDYNAWTPAVGKYSLTATPYTEAGGAGTAGTALTITFKFINRTGIITAQAKPTVDRGLQAYPNPSADGHYQVVLPEAVQGSVHYTLLSAVGALVAEGTVPVAQATTLLPLDFSRQLPAAGLYYVRLQGKKLNAQLKLVRR
ncbi:T9SS type A sorting domain-containing protein [Hymenobacter elongatus]|uniref:T9SS type A sorting domain-containing protein n=1 Tax=Hymenobacter elongatus TaxID=877208 RepID=A0A4Z0PQG0_9BACT|nr:T9SS type A sorting domain-containing protein [Hymenobacter elongatus]TGE17332.1 T9SS type A sorting domain-containing protein [Hymenobacter elongatus]